MSRVSGKELLESLQAEKQPKHDTLYCNPSHADKLEQAVSSGVMFRTSNIDKIAGLDVIELPRIDIPIVCEKGEVFDLAKDWKE